MRWWDRFQAWRAASQYRGIARFAVGNGDVLVLQASAPVSQQARGHLERVFEKFFPGTRILVLDPELTITAVIQTRIEVGHGQPGKR